MLVEVEKPQHAKNLLKLKTFFNIKSICFPHGSLNISKGVIRCPDLAGVSDQEIAQELKPQLVTDARRIKIKRDQKLLETNTIILTFGTAIMPRTIRVGYLVTKVDIYIPNPLQCFHCFKFGHGSKACKIGQAVCGKCGGNGYEHNEEDCKHPLKCVNCQEEHSARSKHCTVWKTEKEVLQVKYSQNISFPDARKIVSARHSTPAATYSSITKTVSNKTTQCFDAIVQTDESFLSRISKDKTKQTETDSTKQQHNLQKETTHVKNTPHYENTNKSNSDKPSRRVSQTPKQKIDIATDRVKKGSKDPIQNHNRFAALSDEEEMEGDMDVVPDCPPSLPSTAKGGKVITRITPPD